MVTVPIDYDLEISFAILSFYYLLVFFVDIEAFEVFDLDDVESGTDINDDILRI